MIHYNTLYYSTSSQVPSLEISHLLAATTRIYPHVELYEQFGVTPSRDFASARRKDFFALLLVAVQINHESFTYLKV